MAAKQSWLSRWFGRSRAQGTPETPPPSTWQEGRLLLDDFVTERLLGEGGMGTVYLVRSQSTGQRFAVKKTKLRDAVSQRNFLAELQTWIDLPEHPHLAACRFFRTVGDQLAIFADYVDGGSLAAWIQGRKLPCLDQVLDVAIQFAWGLHAAHELGLVHQDVKPGNVLMTANGVAKVADFGLARARAAAGEAAGAAGQSILVSAGGRTQAYCSPEQAAERPLSRKTDVWSWGVSVLELFTGEVTWMAGPAATDALESSVGTGAVDPRLPAMPAGLVDVLRRCFRHEPADRWPNMAEVADSLQRIYRQVVGREYPRQAPAVPVQGGRAPVELDRGNLAVGGRWTDPREWLRKAFQATGQDTAAVGASVPPGAGSRKAQTIADMAIYEEARRLFERLIADGQTNLETELAMLCTEQALVHWSLDDLPGALAHYDRAIAIGERLVNREGQRERAKDLAEAYRIKAMLLRALGTNQAALAMHDRSIDLYERLVDREGRGDLANLLAEVYIDKAIALSDLNDSRSAVALCDRGIAVRERLVHKEGRRELNAALALAYRDKAVMVRRLGDDQAAVAFYDQAIAIYERLVNQEGHREWAGELASTCMNKGLSVSDLGDYRAAMALYDQAIAIFEPCVSQDGRIELASELAITYMNKAIAFWGLADHRMAVEFYDRAIALHERLVNQEGRRELAYHLAKEYVNKAFSVRALGDTRAALALTDRSIEIWERLVHREGRQEFQGELDKTKGFRKVLGTC